MHNLFQDLMMADKPDEAEILFRMQQICRISRELFLSGRRQIRPGISTEKLAACFTAQLALQEGGKVGISHIHINVNEEVFHCLPGSRILLTGDILTVDMVLSDGVVFSDGAWSYGVGEIAPERTALIRQAWLTSCAAASAVKAGDSFLVMQEAVASSLAGSGFSLVPEACGHGIGLKIHGDPEIPFTCGSAGNPVWKENTLCTMEPVLVTGSPEVEKADGKGYRMKDGCDSAYFEHVILVAAERALCLNIPEINVEDCIDIFQGFN